MTQSKKLSKEEQKIELKKLHEAITRAEIIPIVKQIRTLNPSCSLTQAKEIADSARDNSAKYTDIEKAYETIVFALRNVLYPVYTKEQFMSLIERAYDTAEDLFTDPLEAVLYCLNNLKSKGGLQYVAQKADEFIEGL